MDAGYILFISGVLSVCLFIGALYFVVHHQVVDFSALAHYDPGTPSLVLDEDGNEWTRFQLDKREPVDLERMPQHLIDAFIAAEDWGFFSHNGLSWKGIARSLLVNLYHGRKMQGASTITQQLVRLLFFNAKKTFRRKLKEQLFALLVERQFTKAQIMQTYLNHVCFGCGIYGVQAAAQRFWGKSVEEITVEQAATLAGIVRSPANYCPLVYPLSAQRRRNIVLGNMKKLGYITHEDYANIIDTNVQVTENIANQCAPHVKEMIRQFLEDLIGRDQLYAGGLTIQTTLNSTLQRQAEQVFVKRFAQLKEKIDPEVDGALISMHTKTGAIKVLIGGYDFAVSKFNRAVQARRQMGSIFKPVLYAAALNNGMQFFNTEVDEPLTLEINNQLWSPNNYNKKFNGEITLAYALSHSNNIVSVKTFLQTGSELVIELAKKCRLTGPFHPYPSLALGCLDQTLWQATGMFNVFANDGVYVEPYIISWVKDRWGNRLYRHEPIAERVLSSRVSSQVAKVLSIGIHRVKKYFGHLYEKWVDAEVISKTGTTNDSRTCWYIGATPELTTAIYFGCDDNREMGKNVYPTRTIFPIWLGINSEISCNHKQFTYDPSLTELVIHEKTGKVSLNEKAPGVISIFV